MSPVVPDPAEVVFPGFREIAERNRRAVVHDLAARREELGLSQATVARRMGTTQSAVARLEGGTVDVRLSTIDRYAAALGLEARLDLHAPGDEACLPKGVVERKPPGV